MFYHWICLLFFPNEMWILPAATFMGHLRIGDGEIILARGQGRWDGSSVSWTWPVYVTNKCTAVLAYTRHAQDEVRKRSVTEWEEAHDPSTLIEEIGIVGGFWRKKCISFQSWRVIDQRKEDIEVGDVEMCVDPGRADINKIKYIVWNSQIINRKNIICIICLEYKGYSGQTSLLSNYIASTWHLTVEVDHDWFSHKPSAGLSHSNFLLPVSHTWKEDSISSWY